jgi:hypothetical protein
MEYLEEIKATLKPNEKIFIKEDYKKFIFLNPHEYEFNKIDNLEKIKKIRSKLFLYYNIDDNDDTDAEWVYNWDKNNDLKEVLNKYNLKIKNINSLSAYIVKNNKINVNKDKNDNKNIIKTIIIIDNDGNERGGTYWDGYEHGSAYWNNINGLSDDDN